MREVKQPTIKRTLMHRVEDAFDSVVSVFSPRQAAERMAVRRRWRVAEARFDFISDPRMAGTFEGASADNLRASSWLGSRLSPDSAMEADLPTLRSRSLELYRNDAIGGAVDGRTNLVVSYGFTPQARIAERPGIATAEQADKWNQELEDVYAQTAPAICKTGKRSLWQLARLVERHHGAYGESFTILSDRYDRSRPIPLTLEVVDPERVETPPGRVNDKLVRLGVEYSESGEIVGYFVRRAHPGDTLNVDQNYDWYPAERVLHVFEALFAGQSRGLPWLIRTLNRAKDAKDIDEAAIIAAQVEACFAAFVTSPMGGGRAADGALASNANGDRVEDIRPGTIRYLDQGEQVNFGMPSKSGTFSPIQEWNYRRAAAGMNYPYEMLVKNWQGTSFSGGRLALTEGRLFVQSQQQLLIECWFCKIWERLTFEAVLVGAVSIPARLYEAYAWWLNRNTWTPPAWPFALTPGEEIDAKIKAVNNNLMPKAKVIGEFGGYMKDVFVQRRDERQIERDYEILPPDEEANAIELQSVQQQEQQTQQAVKQSQRAAEEVQMCHLEALKPRKTVKEFQLGRNERMLVDKIIQIKTETGENVIAS